MASVPLTSRFIPRVGKDTLPLTERFEGDTLIAIHTHLIVRAKIQQAEATASVREAVADARRAGICPRVMARALRMLDPGEQALDRAAAAVVRAYQETAIGGVETPTTLSAFSPTAPAATLIAPNAGEAA